MRRRSSQQSHDRKGERMSNNAKWTDSRNSGKAATTHQLRNGSSPLEDDSLETVAKISRSIIDIVESCRADVIFDGALEARLRGILAQQMPSVSEWILSSLDDLFINEFDEDAQGARTVIRSESLRKAATVAAVRGHARTYNPTRSGVFRRRDATAESERETRLHLVGLERVLDTLGDDFLIHLKRQVSIVWSVNSAGNQLEALLRNRLEAEIRLRLGNETLSVIGGLRLQAMAGTSTVADARCHLVSLHEGTSSLNFVVTSGAIGARADWRRSGPCVLYSFAAGIEEFTDLEMLHRSLLRRAERDDTYALHFSFNSSGRAGEITDSSIGYISLPAMFDYGKVVEQLQGAQVEAMEDGWSRMSQDDVQATDAIKLSMDVSTTIADIFDPAQLLLNVNRRLVFDALPAWMGKTNEADADRLAQLLDAALTSADDYVEMFTASVQDLEAFTIDAAQAYLDSRFPGKGLQARDLMVDFRYNSSRLRVAVPMYQFLVLRPQNIGFIWAYREGEREVRLLEEQALRHMAHDLDIGGKYPEHLRQLLRGITSSGLKNAFRAHWLDGLALDIAIARLDTASGFDAGTLRWMEAVHAYPEASHRPAVGGKPVNVSGLIIAGASVDGVVLIEQSLPSQVVFYAPGAPDGRPLRIVSDRPAMAGLMKRPEWVDYLVERVSVAERGRIRAILESGRFGREISLHPIKGNVADVLFAASVRFLAANVQAETVSNSDISAESFLSSFNLLLDVLAPVSFGVIPAAQIAVAVFNGLDARQRGALREAEGYFFNALLALPELAAGAVMPLKGRMMAGTRVSRVARVDGGRVAYVKDAPPLAGRAGNRVSLEGYQVNVEPGALHYSGRGIFTDGTGREFIVMNGQVFRSDIKTGRRHVIRPYNWSDSYEVAHTSDGWRPLPRPGLRGGGKGKKATPSPSKPQPQWMVDMKKFKADSLPVAARQNWDTFVSGIKEGKHPKVAAEAFDSQYKALKGGRIVQYQIRLSGAERATFILQDAGRNSGPILQLTGLGGHT